ncbi:hypothetical protein LSM04_003869 [Trypanosoma melophagium]|uniref:uncharacterized protein n=1 Tax=Trypanosoma melophagium TaxID=715481 RepID=UPI003519FE60|nr:hypothetical protein LSM04_003869 [Trypanosoma melophagium]
MPTKKTTEESDDYTPQELLTAATLEYKKLEATNQSSMERMYGALSSPFKIAERPCEAQRTAVLHCFEKIRGTTGNSVQGNENGPGNVAEMTVGSNINSNVPITTSEFPPVHNCYDSVLLYESCVLEKSLAQHHSLVASFEARHVKNEKVVEKDG